MGATFSAWVKEKMNERDYQNLEEFDEYNDRYNKKNLFHKKKFSIKDIFRKK